MLRRIEQRKSVSISQISIDWAEQMSFYRFLNNPRVRLAEVIENQVGGQNWHQVKTHVLALNDTTSVNLEKHSGRLKEEGVGYIGGGKFKQVGFHLHPCLVVDAESFDIRGLSSIRMWAREEPGVERKKVYKKLAIEEKESYKWIRAAEETKKSLPFARQITMIGDREADVYEEFVRVPDERTHLLIRSCQNRRLNSGGNLYERLAEAEVIGSYQLEVEADKRIDRKKRKALIEVRIAEVEIAAPNGYAGGVQSVKLHAIEAREGDAPPGVEPIHWRLLTTHEVTDYEQTRKMIGYYSQRWEIEQLFRVLKKQGLDIESSELETVGSIQKLSVMALSVAVKTMQLVKSREGSEQQITEVFSEQEVECLESLNGELEGKTKKQQNPHRRETLSYAAWVISRLGGWKGYTSQRPPGVITIKRGLERFETILFGFSMTCV